VPSGLRCDYCQFIIAFLCAYSPSTHLSSSPSAAAGAFAEALGASSSAIASVIAVGRKRKNQKLHGLVVTREKLGSSSSKVKTIAR
jgi:stage V sporulation protein SpoVS